jgi:adenine-specific DNA methylase
MNEEAKTTQEKDGDEILSCTTQRVGKAVFQAGAVAVGALTLSILPFLIVPWLPRKLFGSLPYMQTPRGRILDALDLVERLGISSSNNTKQGRRRFLDLGSGDGAWVIEAARRGYHATGVELNPT